MHPYRDMLVEAPKPSRLYWLWGRLKCRLGRHATGGGTTIVFADEDFDVRMEMGRCARCGAAFGLRVLSNFDGTAPCCQDHAAARFSGCLDGTQSTGPR